MPEEIDTQPTPQTSPVPPKSLLTRPWMGWVVALVASGVLVAALVSDHNRMVDRLSATRGELTDARESTRMLEVRVDSLDSQLDQAGDRETALDDALQVCVRGLDNGVKLYNNLVKELNAAVNLSISDFDRFHGKAAGLRKKANRSLDDCRDAAA